MIPVLLVTANVLGVILLSIIRLRRRPWSLLDPAWAFLIGYSINYCVRPALFLWDPEVGGIYQDYIYSALLIKRGVDGALLFSMLGLAGFAVGDLRFSRCAGGLSRRIPTMEVVEFACQPIYGAIAFVLLVAGCAGLYGFVSIAGWAGPILELFSGGQRDAFMQVILGHGYYTFAMQLSLVGWAMMCAKWTTFPTSRKSLGRAADCLYRGGWFLCTLLIWVGLGERASMITVLFIPIALYFTMSDVRSESARRKRRRVMAWALVVVLFSVLVAGPVGLLMKGKEVTSPAIVAMAISAWDSFEFTIAAQNSIRIEDLFLGRTYLSDVFYTWLPRSMFPEKPERYGAVLVQDRVAPDLSDNIGATFPTGFLVEAYANFWYFGVFVIPMLLGLISQALHRVLIRGDWFWILQLVLLFPSIASFRSVGWTAAQLTANFVTLLIIMGLCSFTKSVSRALRNVEVLQSAQ